MLASLRKIFRVAAEHAPDRFPASIPAGERVYAIGDIHGRLDLFSALIAAIDADDESRGPAQTTVILLGDLIDRGPDSAGVIATAREWGQRRRLRIIAGNHEEMLLRSLDDNEVLRGFLRFGGEETLFSYPITPEEYTAADYDALRAIMLRAIPAEDIAFLQSFEDAIAIGDYLFVHAGIDPEVPLEEQKTTALRWIREPFLSHPGDFGAVVVHGHTIFEDADIRTNRIAIDTGAWTSGRLTALVLEGSARSLIEARDDDGAIGTSILPL